MSKSTLARRRSLITQAQAAEFLGVTDRTIRNYVSRGILPAYRVGGRVVRIDQADVDRLLRRIPTTASDAGFEHFDSDAR